MVPTLEIVPKKTGTQQRVKRGEEVDFCASACQVSPCEEVHTWETKACPLPAFRYDSVQVWEPMFVYDPHPLMESQEGAAPVQEGLPSGL